jgi:uncharacterized membrane protein YoaK (UPF0700 family)
VESAGYAVRSSSLVIASLCRRYLWVAHPHGATVLTTLCLLVATAADTAVRGWSGQLTFVPILFVACGIGALNTSFVENGEVSIPLSYVTGTLVKMGQGIARHITGGSHRRMCIDDRLHVFPC